MGDHKSGPQEAVRGTVEGVKGKVKEVGGTITGRDDLVEEGQAQQDKADAQRDAGTKEAEADSARAGYPSGAPPFGYAPLLALLPRRVCDDEITAIATALTGRKPRAIDDADVGVEILKVTDEMPSPDDIDRVQGRLDAMGWAGG